MPLTPLFKVLLQPITTTVFLPGKINATGQGMCHFVNRLLPLNMIMPQFALECAGGAKSWAKTDPLPFVRPRLFLDPAAWGQWLLLFGSWTA